MAKLAGQAMLEPDHYLEILLHKPGALIGSTALEQAPAAGRFNPVHDAWWAAAVKAHGDAPGTRELIGVRHLPHDLVVIGLARALPQEHLPLTRWSWRRERPPRTTPLKHLINAMRLAGRLRFASLPTPATLLDFDVEDVAGIDRKLIDELGTCRYLESATNILLIGPSEAG